MAALPLSVAGFSVLPITYGSSSTHILYARAHIGSKKSQRDSFPDGRTLFLVNVPPDATERELVLLFKNCGMVERVIFDSEVTQQHDDEDDEEDDGQEGHDGMAVDEEDSGADEHPRKKRKVTKEDKRKPPKVTPLPHRTLRTLQRTGRSAHIVFLDSSSLDKAIASQKPRPWPTSSGEPSGLAHYAALYDSLRPPLDIVREHADTSMELYEYELAKTKQKSKYRKGEAIVDEDGFTLVTRGGAYGQTLGGGVGVASKKFQETGQTRNRNKKKKPKEKVAFYAFQKAEKQRKGASPL